MDHFFPDPNNWEESTLWDLVSGDGEKSVSVVNRSAFRAYVKGREESVTAAESARNVNKRMVNLVRKNWEEKKRAAAPEREKGRRHMIKERIRREKQKQSYLDLHSLLPIHTKSDKKTIVEKAVNQIGDLQRLKRELERRIKALERKLDDEMIMCGRREVKFNVREPLSGIDSMIEVVKCLKSMGTNLKSVHANFSSREFAANMTIETQIRGEEVEKTVERRLHETEWKLLFLPEAPFHGD